MKHRLPLLAVLVALVATCSSAADAPPLPGGVELIPGPVQGCVFARNGKRLAVYGDPSGTVEAADMVLFTHARRDAAWAGRALVEKGARAVVPAGDADLFEKADEFWKRFTGARFHDYAQASSKVLAAPLPVSRKVRGGDTITWEGLAFRVLDTPGPTRGSVTYLATLDGKTIAFTGDLIQGDGKLLDLFGLQDAIPEAKLGGYHGWAGRLGDVVASLRRVAAERPDIIVPARGKVIRDPQGALHRLISRIGAVYSNYLSIDALRWYFGDEHIRAKARRVLGPDAEIDWMPMAETRGLPPWVAAISNSRLLLAADGSGFLVDCGGKDIVDALKKMRDEGRLKSIDGVFITHYHDDHTDAVPALVEAFGCKVHAVRELVPILERPGDFRLPCLTRNPIAVTAPHESGARWRWKEHHLAAWYFPGQTIWHDALLVERGGGERLLFIGDSFTPSGIDDYCLQNRNLLRDGTGFLACIDLVERLAPDWLLNQHVEPMFRFTSEHISRLRETLRGRVGLLVELLPWDDPNFGLDEGWARFEPYAYRHPGDDLVLSLRLTNHSARPRAFQAKVHLQPGLEVEGPGRESVTVAPGKEGCALFTIPWGSCKPGTYILTADVAWEDSELIEWAEAMVEVTP